MIGYSIYLYHLDRDDVEGIARRLRQWPGKAGGAPLPRPAPGGGPDGDE